MTGTTPTVPEFVTRECDPVELLGQIGHPNVLAISGGRVAPTFGRDTDTGERYVDGVALPVRYGYRVEVRLAADDTYTVRRIFARGGREWVKWEANGVYADLVGEVAYEASCYHN